MGSRRLVAREYLAWVDESIVELWPSGGRRYILAAAVVNDDGREFVRDSMRAMLLARQSKLHWRDEGRTRRATIAKAVSLLPFRSVVVIRTWVPHERPERQRRLCLERLLHELAVMRVYSCVVESRGRSDDKRDRSMVDALRARGVLGSSLRVTHVAGVSDPGLWLADVFCGAAHEAELGNRENATRLTAANETNYRSIRI